jgi:Na+-translocating ferredoxin:NAD+ oxidoreductase RNF subunit RnfB
MTDYEILKQIHCKMHCIMEQLHCLLKDCEECVDHCETGCPELEEVEYDEEGNEVEKEEEAEEDEDSTCDR